MEFRVFDFTSSHTQLTTYYISGWKKKQKDKLQLKYRETKEYNIGTFLQIFTKEKMALIVYIKAT